MGHNQYHQFYFSDHRAGFLDLADRASLRLSSPIAPTPRRHINSNSPLVAKFVSAVNTHLVATGVFHKFANFLLDVDSDEKPYITANQIDSQVTFGLLHGDKICSKPPTHPWSEKLHHASLRVRYWKTHLSSLCNRVVTPMHIDDFTKILGPMPAGPHTKADATKYLSIATQQLRKARKGAVAQRAAFLEELKTRIASRKTPTTLEPAAALKMIDRQLRTTSSYRRIRKALHKDSFEPLTKVTVTRTETYLNPVTSQRVNSVETHVISSRQALETAILERNQRHFAQAKNTP
jgi:hypothetical protein